MENATFDELIARLRRLYKAFNSRDIALVLWQMAPDVNWPNAWEGRRVGSGHPAERSAIARGARARGARPGGSSEVEPLPGADQVRRKQWCARPPYPGLGHHHQQGRGAGDH